MANTMTAMIPPSSPRRIDWASMQSSSRQSSENYDVPSRSDIQTPPPKNPAPSPASDMPGRLDQSPSQRRASIDRVYDLPTLLKYRGSLAGLSVFAKIRPEALAENLFQYIGHSRLPKPLTRTRALSELSNRSFRGEPGSNPKIGDTSQVTNNASVQHGQSGSENLHPKRNDGFVRFLKQHASPPHHRVTAGGRIVPAGPHSPPPMFDYESLTGMMDQRRHMLQNAPPVPQNAGFAERPQGQTWPASYSAPVKGASQHLPGLHPHLPTVHNLHGHMPVPGAQSVLQNPNAPATNFHMALVPISSFGDGSTLATCNGMYFRAYWNGMGTTVEPLPILPGQSATAGPAEPARRTIQVDNLPRPTVSSQHPPQNVPVLGRANRPQSSESQSSRSAPMFDAQERRLKASLSELDRQMALHHYELSHEQRVSCVSQRRSLVEEIDSIRRAREASTSESPLLDFKDLTKGASFRNGQSLMAKESAIGKKPRSVSMLQINNGQSRKGLSPNAPPFIPHRFQKDLQQMPGKTLAESARMHCPRDGRESSSIIAPKIGAEIAQKSEISLERDPDDPAMRVIHKSDISYAAKYENETVSGKKRYCTKVSEFQEALRRVREQARLYGCAGGSSKDPAYDAEQDIWWAICDHDPIPLPPDSPEHVKYPQPWDWNRSVFNYRAKLPTITNQQQTSAGAFPIAKSKEMLDKATSTDDGVPRTTSGAKPQSVQQESLLFQNHDAKSELPAHKPSAHPSKGDDSTKSMATLQSSKVSKQPVNPKAKTKSYSESDSQTVKSKEVRIPLAISSGNRQKSVSAKEDEPLVLSRNHLPKQQGASAGQPKSPSESVRQIKSESTDRASNDSSKDSFKSAAESVSSVNGPILKSQKSNANLNVRSKAPKRVKSKQRLQNQTLGRRHRQNLKQAELSKQKSSGSFRASSTRMNLSEVGVKPYQDEMSDKSPRSLFSVASQQLSPRSAAKKAIQFYDRSRSKSPLKRRQSGSQLKALQPHVRLPALSSTHLQDKATPNASMPSETKSVAVKSPSKSQPKDSFLREMIRNARFMSSQTGNKKISPAKNDPSHKLQGLAESTMSETNKENELADAPSKKSRGSTAKSDDSSLDVSYSRIAGKTTSSLAASSFHANAFLPQYDGAGKAQTATVQRQHCPDIPLRQPRVSLPSSSPYSDLVHSRGRLDTSADSKSNRSRNKGAVQSSTSFGLDGSGDEPPKGGEGAGLGHATAKGKQAAFDTRGLTEADFDPKGEDVKNEEHYREVDKFFDKLAAQEKEHMARKLRENKKTA